MIRRICSSLSARTRPAVDLQLSRRSGGPPVSSAGANRGDHGRVERYRSRGRPPARSTRWLAARARGARPRAGSGGAAGPLGAEPVLCDVTRDADVAELARAAAARGGCDLLVQCAGASRGVSLARPRSTTIASALELNYLGLIRVFLAIWPQLVERNGRIVNVVSVAGTVPLERSTAVQLLEARGARLVARPRLRGPVPRRHGDDREPGAGADARVPAVGDRRPSPPRLAAPDRRRPLCGGDPGRRGSRSRRGLPAGALPPARRDPGTRAGPRGAASRRAASRLASAPEAPSARDMSEPSRRARHRRLVRHRPRARRAPRRRAA